MQYATQIGRYLFTSQKNLTMKDWLRKGSIVVGLLVAILAIVLSTGVG
jgi:hypothetical protein